MTFTPLGYELYCSHSRQNEKIKKFWDFSKNLLTNTLVCGIIQTQGARKTKVACECVGAEVKCHGEVSNSFFQF